MSKVAKLHVLSLALAMGIIFAVMMLVFGLIAWSTGLWAEAVGVIGTAYLGYAPTLPGSLIGAVWGFIDGFVFGALLAWLYNGFCRRFTAGE